MISLDYWYRSTARLNFKQSPKEAGNLIIANRSSEDYPDTLWEFPYRIIISELIINKSSKPISITNFKIYNSNALLVSKFSSPGIYVATLKNSSNKYPYSDVEIDTHKKFYKLPLNLGPYQAVQSNIVFALKKLHNIHKNTDLKIIVNTSRKNFKFNIKIYNFYKTIKAHQI